MDRRVAIAVLAAACLMAGQAGAQVFSGDWSKELRMDHPATKSAEDKKVEAEILGLQAALRAAAAGRDKATLERYYTPDFTMTHGSGALHDRQARIDFIAATGGGFEPMTPEVQSIRILNRNAAVSIANNSGKVNGRSIYIRYMIVYTRGKPDEGFKGWREAAAQVTMINAAAPSAP